MLRACFVLFVCFLFCSSILAEFFEIPVQFSIFSSSSFSLLSFFYVIKNSTTRENNLPQTVRGGRSEGGEGNPYMKGVALKTGVLTFSKWLRWLDLFLEPCHHYVLLSSNGDFRRQKNKLIFGAMSSFWSQIAKKNLKLICGIYISCIVQESDLIVFLILPGSHQNIYIRHYIFNTFRTDSESYAKSFLS